MLNVPNLFHFPPKIYLKKLFTDPQNIDKLNLPQQYLTSKQQEFSRKCEYFPNIFYTNIPSQKKAKKTKKKKLSSFPNRTLSCPSCKT